MEDTKQVLSPPPPPHRSFVSVELPFLVAPAAAGVARATTALAQAQRAEVEAFLPPSFLGPCLLSTSSSSPSSRSAPTPAAATAVTASTARQPKRARPPGADADQSSEDEGEEGVLRDGGKEIEDVKTPAEEGLGLDVADPDAYSPTPVFTGWRPTDWGVDSQRRQRRNPRGGDTGKEAEDRDEDDDDDNEAFLDGVKSETTFLQRQRREVFPSLVPQLLLQGYYRNDLLVKVTRRRRVRRLRDAETGDVVREEEICTEAGDGRDGNNNNSEDARAWRPSAEVVGVVSRDVQLARPADFCFSLFRPEDVAAAPHCCSADLFPPMRFLGTRSTYQVPYAMGAEVNTSVQAQRRRQQLPPTDDGVAATRQEEGDDAAAAQDDDDDNNLLKRVVVGLAVEAEDPNIPPRPLFAHKSYLAYLGCSPTVIANVMAGESATRQPPPPPATAAAPSERDEVPECPAEVRVLSSFLASRPVWLTSELKKAMLNSGVCPRAFTNKQVITCMTYCVRNGPFNRLRIRMGYNPYASSLGSAVYQRLAVRMLRRSEIGVQVRDLARSPHIQAAVQAIHRKHADGILAARRRMDADRARVAGERKDGGASGAGCFGTLVELFCSVVSTGTLSVACQFADVQDDEVYRELIARAAPATDMPAARRRFREGWLTPQAYQRALSHFTEALTTFLHDEVVPAVRQLSAGPAAPLPTSSSEESDNEEEEEEERSSSSSPSADVSSGSGEADGEDEEDADSDMDDPPL